MDCPAIALDGLRGQQRARRLIHERHKLVRKSWHRAADANPPNIRTTSDAAHPAAFSYVALNHRSPASQFDDAQRRPVIVRKLRLFVIAATVAAFMNGRPEEPRRTERIVERNC